MTDESVQPLWRCPACDTMQAPSARCWLCARSATSCASCQNFRPSIAPGVGFCGLDRRRLPLHGDEVRGCWESPVVWEPGRGTLLDLAAAGTAGPELMRRR